MAFSPVRAQGRMGAKYVRLYISWPTHDQLQGRCWKKLCKLLLVLIHREKTHYCVLQSNLWEAGRICGGLREAGRVIKAPTFHGSRHRISLSASAFNRCWFSGVNSPSDKRSFHTRQARAKNSLFSPDVLSLSTENNLIFTTLLDRSWLEIEAKPVLKKVQ